MRINFAHLRERSTTGAYVDFAVFDADASTHRNDDRTDTLQDLVMKARSTGLKIDAAALAFHENGRTRFYGDRIVVEYLSRMGVPQWNRWIEP